MVKASFFYLMNRNNLILEFSYSDGFVGTINMIDESLAPEMVKLDNAIAFERWLSERCADLTRPNIRLLLKKMKLSKSKVEIVIENRALSLTDTYWIKKSEEEVYEDFSLFRKDVNRLIAQTALSGSLRNINVELNPELTNLGSFNKAWLKERNEWVLAKTGDDKSIYAELFTYQLLKLWNMDCAIYKYSDDMLKSTIFTSEERILEHYASYRYKFNDISVDDLVIFENLKDVRLHESYRNLLFADAFVCNVDRHEFNFGVIKDSSNGKILGLAPNFDNNLSFGGVSNPSLVMMKMYIKEFGLSDAQVKLISLTSLDILSEIDQKVRQMVNPDNLSRKMVLDYFNGIFELIEKSTKM